MNPSTVLYDHSHFDNLFMNVMIMAHVYKVYLCSSYASNFSSAKGGLRIIDCGDIICTGRDENMGGAT